MAYDRFNHWPLLFPHKPSQQTAEESIVANIKFYFNSSGNDNSHFLFNADSSMAEIVDTVEQGSILDWLESVRTGANSQLFLDIFGGSDSPHRLSCFSPLLQPPLTHAGLMSALP